MEKTRTIQKEITRMEKTTTLGKVRTNMEKTIALGGVAIMGAFILAAQV
jgi:hypothetical protein